MLCIILIYEKAPKLLDKFTKKIKILTDLEFFLFHLVMILNRLAIGFKHLNALLNLVTC